MKAYKKWHGMIASIAFFATSLLSTSGNAAPTVRTTTLSTPSLTLLSAHEEDIALAAWVDMPTALTAPALLDGLAVAYTTPGSLQLTPGLLGYSASSKRKSRAQRDEEAFKREYLGYAIMITGGALVVVGGLGLLASTKAPGGTSGTVAVLGLGAMAGGGFLIYWGYQYKQEAAALTLHTPRAPLLVGYAGSF